MDAPPPPPPQQAENDDTDTLAWVSVIAGGLAGPMLLVSTEYAMGVAVSGVAMLAGITDTSSTQARIGIALGAVCGAIFALALL